MKNKYKFNKRQRKISLIDSNKSLLYFPPIENLSGEVILIDGKDTKVVWEREKEYGIWHWDDLLYEERLEHFFSK